MDEKNYEEAAKNAILNNSENAENIEYRSLGKAASQKTHLGDSDEAKILKAKIGYTELVMENLPSKGKFYSEDMKILIRAASVAEIRDFSTLDETSLYDVDDKLNNILVACTKIEYDTKKMGNYKDILEEDRIFIILSIRELTFIKGENKITLGAVCTQCGHANSYELKTNNLQYNDSINTLDKYYNPDTRIFEIRTKSAGLVKMSPPTIGVMKEITNYIKKKDENKERWDKGFMQIMPYLVKEWRGFNDRAIFNNLVDYEGWNTGKYNVLFKLADTMKFGVKSEFIEFCSNCDAEVTVPVTFRNGIKSLFVISDISGELL